ncbi:Hypothetical protein R9X50_00762200 [Acrodontium crateriforme]|uniref:Uncharacterized protein n=1 Tax=Acrodontium crateriforme TaxID=150365 RepID=A0AAQ3ME23_9PEZI|nr:Hypothetical protein R9X50_00762200 [Acrodontium crateriforme]
MANDTPKARLRKLFRKSPASSPTSDHASLSSPMAAKPPSNDSNQGRLVRKRASRMSLSNVFHGRGRSSSISSKTIEALSPQDVQLSLAATSSALASASSPNSTNPILPRLPPSRDFSNDFHMGKFHNGQNENDQKIAHANVVKDSARQSPPTERTDWPLSWSRPSERRSLSRKSSLTDLRNAERKRPTTADSSQQPGNNQRHIVNLEKTLPKSPSDEFNAGFVSDENANHNHGVHSALGLERGYLIKDATQPVDLNGIVDLTHSNDTTIHQHWAPAVTHETIRKDVHTIREERITREIHNHTVYHRILPIIDIEVLPARHFIPVEGGYCEIAEDEVPGQAGKNAQWLIAETVSKMLPASTGSSCLPHRFTARTFAPDEGQYKEYTSPDGIPRTETTWVHQPTMEIGGMHTGQTHPFHFGSPDSKDDGLRAQLPAGNTIGVSPMLAEQQRKRLEAERAAIQSSVQAASA